MQRDEILCDILKSEITKACHGTDIPTKIVKENADVFANIFVSNFNDSIEKSIFHPYYKQKPVTETLRIAIISVRILPNVPKTFERYGFRQLSNFMDQFFVNTPMWFS